MTLIVIHPKRFIDRRGWFVESWNKLRFEEQGVTTEFVQDNHSYSTNAGTIRGLHFQRPPHAQAKLVRCLKGRIFDVAVDLRPGSPTFGEWAGIELSADLGNQLFIPPGYAHGFLTLEAECEIAYKVDAYYSPEADAGIAWDDPVLAINWPLNGLVPVLSDKDATLPNFSEVETNFEYNGCPLLPLKGL
ncbi:dTDP-4-dehydrorhamnose 3,5-epimerase [Sphingorhabdus pulchriflava]|uniref:dTDP-4-dehydrorhamnose 3,5-epimerase n=1 Tax=Sphingorhabdus pulchriflava TaxID=2292257 RepID=A0A371B1P3_9SPHN|nr:dTDP-4-dehydrorhamnose 3,5-epimerase [Sphingorhabdus pulchriflava]RDV01478.1 dTDP-4-dehydrorhamnose 3,5-epimerase [Sphingorhabdus pulchriflava]